MEGGGREVERNKGWLSFLDVERIYVCDSSCSEAKPNWDVARGVVVDSEISTSLSEERMHSNQTPDQRQEKTALLSKKGRFQSVPTRHVWKICFLLELC